jgi:hypothetical protein
MEETAFKTNMDAGEEIARQLRLRDLGGLVVIDFIDMRDRKHIQEVERCLKTALKRDKARTEMSRISKFGLLEVSRQRLKPALQDETSLPCPHCRGQGLIRSKESLGLTVLRKIQGAAVKGNLLTAKAKVPLEAANYLLNEKRDRLLKLEQEYSIRIHVEGDAALTGSLFNLTLDKKDIAAIEEEPLDIETEILDEIEVGSVATLEEELASEEVPATPETVPPEAFEEPLPVAAEVADTMTEAMVSTEMADLAAVVESAPAGNGNPLKHEVSTPLWQPTRRLRFWWLRRNGRSLHRMASESPRPAVDDVVQEAQTLSVASTTPTPSVQIPRREAIADRLSDRQAPWRRMFPRIKPPLQLPRRGADEAPSGGPESS